MSLTKRFIHYAAPYYGFAYVLAIGGAISGRWPVAVGLFGPLLLTPLLLLLFAAHDWQQNRRTNGTNLPH